MTPLIFSEYEKVFVKNMLEADPAGQAGRYFKRIREVMKGKYNIVDQFVVVASCIAGSSAEMELAESWIQGRIIQHLLFLAKTIFDV